MDTFKTQLFIAGFCAAIWFAVPCVQAAPNATDPPTPATEKSTESGTETETKLEKTMWDLVRAGGVVMWALAALALYGFYSAGAQIYVIVFSNDHEKDKKFLGDLVASGESRGDVMEAEIQKRDKGVFPRVCEAALAEMKAGKAAMEEALAIEGALQLGMLKRGLRPLQIVVAVAPLLGLLGTVYGMIDSFQTVEMAKLGDDKAKMLSGGIYVALVTTAAGLTVAIPFLLLYHWLSRKADEIGVNLNRHSKLFLESFTSGGRGGSVMATQVPIFPDDLQPARSPE